MLVGSAAELVRRSVEFSTVRLSCRRYRAIGDQRRI